MRNEFPAIRGRSKWVTDQWPPCTCPWISAPLVWCHFARWSIGYLAALDSRVEISQKVITKYGRGQRTKKASQPMVLPAWNPHGYLNNACHRIAVQVV
jgi:hypothetical protein